MTLSETVSAFSMLSMIATLTVSVLFPIILWIIYLKKDRNISQCVLIGALGFIVPQILIRLPILQLLSLNESWVSFCSNNLILSTFLYAFSAGLFETSGRFLVFGGLLKNNRGYYSAVAAGIGHGGSESIILVGMTYINNLIFSAMINSGSIPQVPEIKNAVAALTQPPPSLFLAAGFERIFTIIFHISLSIIFCWFLSKNSVWNGIMGFIVTVLIHTAADFIIPLISLSKLNIWFTEIILMIISILTACLALYLKPRFDKIYSLEDEAKKASEEGY